MKKVKKHVVKTDKEVCQRNTSNNSGNVRYYRLKVRTFSRLKKLVVLFSRLFFYWSITIVWIMSIWCSSKIISIFFIINNLSIKRIIMLIMCICSISIINIIWCLIIISIIWIISSLLLLSILCILWCICLIWIISIILFLYNKNLIVFYDE
jgi:hypothetical protein